MALLFPVHEIEAQSGQETPEIPVSFDYPHNPDEFSVLLASELMDLCLAAEAQTEPMLIKTQGDHSFIAFRRSGDPATVFNVRGETAVTAIAFGEGCAYRPLVTPYLDQVQAKVCHLPGRLLYLAGHGIGGAFALFAAAELMRQNRTVAAVYTFGAPRVGNANFARTFTCPVFRVVNNLDVVVTMPTAWTWRHVGAQKLINADGSLNANPNPVNRLPSLARQTVWLGEMLRQGLSSGFPRALFTLFHQVLGDHLPVCYSERLRALRHLH